MLKRGDTMIEVLFAVTLFSTVAVAGLSIMNHGASAAQRSLEVTLASQEIDAQAEALRLLYDDTIAQVGSDQTSTTADVWSQVRALGKAESSITPYSGMISGGACIQPADVTNAFIINTRRGTVERPSSGAWKDSAPLYSRVLYADSGAVQSVEGIWIEAARRSTSGGVPGYLDFHIRACWQTIGQDIPVTLGTIVRLYEP